MRIGLGIDVHRLIHDPPRPLMLGGVEIPGDLALEGHSDADALLHAITDAILGALGLGDIGEYFPNTNPAWKDAPSQIFLEHALEAMREHGYALANIDCVIVAEAPKLAPHRTAIRQRLAQWLALTPDAVGLKATTAEKLGTLGRGEGLFAQAVVLLVRDDLPAAPALRTEVAKRSASKSHEKAVAAPPERQVDPASVRGEVIYAWADGASRGNPGPASIGVILRDAGGGVIHTARQRIGEATNNVAEYRALICALQLAAAMMPSKVVMQMDSELVIRQMRREYRVKDENLQKLYAQAVMAADLVPDIEFVHVRREQNRDADRLANEALDLDRE